MSMIDLVSLGERLAVDAVAVVLLAYGIYYRRHGRRDLFVAFVAFNVGVFLALAVMSASRIGAGVGFGLFAILSIIRLRSEPFANVELAYFFLALVLAIGTGLDLGSVVPGVAVAGVVVAAAAVADHPRLLQASRGLEVTLDLASAREDDVRRHLADRVDGELLEVTVLEVDWVRETTRASVRLRPDNPRRRPLAVRLPRPALADASLAAADR